MEGVLRDLNVPTVIVTSGGTREDIDEVRFLTNISTGKLGAKIAERVIGMGWNLVYIHTETSAIPLTPLYYSDGQDENLSEGFPKLAAVKVRSTRDAYDALKKWTPYANVVIHSMACGDFGFAPETTKLKSNSEMAFIESLKTRIFINPKILNEIKGWNPNVVLVSFKFESGQTTENLMEMATASMYKAHGDFVVANDKREMTKTGTHVAYLIPALNSTPVVRIEGKDQIADFVLKSVEKKLHGN